jgi:hypothetical protein
MSVYFNVMVFALQVWGTVSSADFRATWEVEWGSVARWVVAITVRFEISDTVVLFNFIAISFCEGVVWTFKRQFVVVLPANFWCIYMLMPAWCHCMMYTDLFSSVLVTRSGSFVSMVHKLCGVS